VPKADPLWQLVSVLQELTQLAGV